MGTGHVMRCLALAQAAQDQGLEVLVVGRVSVPWVQERLHAERLSLQAIPDAVPHEEDPANLLQQLAKTGFTPADSWVVLDGYHFTLACQLAVRNTGYRLLVIDDYAHLPEYSCDILLNQNLGAEELPYAGDIGLKLLGLRYALLRREFRKARERLSSIKRNVPPQNILVTLGGGDFIEYLERIAQDMSIPAMQGRTLRVLRGAMDAERIKKAFASCPARLEILSRVDDMPSLLLETDLCITAGGSTCWELCCLGVPFLAIKTAVNQRCLIDQLSKREMLFSKTRFQKLRACQTPHGASLEALFDSVDGIGAIRIIDTMFSGMDFRLKIRTARAEDKQFVFDVANTDLVRKMSFNSSKINIQEHDIWYGNAINGGMPFYIFYMNNIRIGYVRFAPINDSDHEVVLTIALAEAFRGKGLGKKALQMACSVAFDAGIKKIKAYVKKENQASAKLFSRCGFLLESFQKYRGFKSLVFFLAQP